MVPQICHLTWLPYDKDYSQVFPLLLLNNGKICTGQFSLVRLGNTGTSLGHDYGSVAREAYWDFVNFYFILTEQRDGKEAVCCLWLKGGEWHCATTSKGLARLRPYVLAQILIGLSTLIWHCIPVLTIVLSEL